MFLNYSTYTYANVCVCVCGGGGDGSKEGGKDNKIIPVEEC